MAWTTDEARPALSRKLQRGLRRYWVAEVISNGLGCALCGCALARTKHCSRSTARSTITTSWLDTSCLVSMHTLKVGLLIKSRV
jgi:hypothetical protein